MPASLTDFASNRMLDLIFGATPFPAPSSLFFNTTQSYNVFRNGLNFSTPLVEGTTRTQVVNNLTNFAISASGIKRNLVQINFGSGNVARIDYGMIISNSGTGGNTLFRYQYDNPDPIGSGQYRFFAANNFTIRQSQDVPGCFTHHLCNRIYDHLFGGVNLLPSSVYYVGLSQTEVTISGTNITEPAANLNYARVQITNNSAYFANAATNCEKTNSARITFNTPYGDWRPKYLFLSDALTGGNTLTKSPIPNAFVGSLTTFSGGPPIIIESGALYFTL